MSVSIPAVTSFKGLIYTHTYTYKIQCDSHVMLALSHWGSVSVPLWPLWSPAQLLPHVSGRDMPDLWSTLGSVAFSLLCTTQVGNCAETPFAGDVPQMHTAHTDGCAFRESHFFILQQHTLQLGVPMPRHGYLSAEDPPAVSPQIPSTTSAAAKPTFRYSILS